MSTSNFEDHISGAVQKAIESSVAESSEAIRKKAHDELDKKIDQAVAAVALNVFRNVQMQRIGEELVITVKKITE